MEEGQTSRVSTSKVHLHAAPSCLPNREDRRPRRLTLVRARNPRVSVTVPRRVRERLQQGITRHASYRGTARGTCLRATRRPPSSGGSARERRRKHHSSLLRGSQMRGRKDKRDGSVATGSSRARGATERGVLFLPSSVPGAQLGTVPLAALASEIPTLV